MSNFPNPPENDDDYDKLLERIVKGAEYLENPLIKTEDYEKGLALYDRLCEMAREYRTKPEERRSQSERVISDRNRSQQDVG